MNCASASELSLSELQHIRRLLRAYPIEVAETRASPKQIAFQRAFENRKDETGRTCDVFVAVGANRSGKSIVAGWLCFAKWLRDQARAGSWYWCITPTLDRSINGVQRELWNALPRWMFGNQAFDEKIGFGGHRKVVLPTLDGGKCLIEFRSSDQRPETFEQAKLDGVWCDERLPEEIYDRLLPRITDRNGFILYSDIPEQWWQHERLINAVDDAGVFFQHFEMADNEHNLPDGAVSRTSAKMTQDQIRQRIKGLMLVMEGVVYKEYDDDVHAIEPFVIPPHWPKWRAIDYGASAPTACVWIALSPDETAYAFREYYQRGLSVERNAAGILDLSRDEKYRNTLIDPHAVDLPPVTYGIAKTIAAQYAEAGIKTEGWPFVQVMGEHALVQRVKYRLENRQLKVFKTCANLRREFRSWKFKTDDDGRPLAADEFENDNNHLLDAIKGFFGTNPAYAMPGRGRDEDGE